MQTRRRYTEIRNVFKTGKQRDAVYRAGIFLETAGLSSLYFYHTFINCFQAIERLSTFQALVCKGMIDRTDPYTAPGGISHGDDVIPTALVKSVRCCVDEQPRTTQISGFVASSPHPRHLSSSPVTSVLIALSMYHRFCICLYSILAVSFFFSFKIGSGWSRTPSDPAALGLCLRTTYLSSLVFCV